MTLPRAIRACDSGFMCQIVQVLVSIDASCVKYLAYTQGRVTLLKINVSENTIFSESTLQISENVILRRMGFPTLDQFHFWGNVM